MAINVKKKSPPTATVTTTTSSKGEVLTENSKQEQVDVPPEVSAQEPTDKQWCEVGYELSYTMNLGNFNSTRINISLKIPCLHEEIEDVFKYGKTWVDSKIEGVVSEIKSE